MIKFTINLEFAGYNITAIANKISKTLNGSTQYHVTDMDPKFDDIPECWMFIHNPDTNLYEYSVPSPDYHPLAKKVLEAIYHNCLQNDIELN